MAVEVICTVAKLLSLVCMQGECVDGVTSSPCSKKLPFLMARGRSCEAWHGQLLAGCQSCRLFWWAMKTFARQWAVTTALEAL